MPKKMNSDEAKKLLSDCNSDQSFWVNNGPVLRNLDDLSAAIKSLSSEQFSHHLNKEKNDFARWVEDVVGDKELSEVLSKVKSKTSATKKINDRLEALHKYAG